MNMILHQMSFDNFYAFITTQTSEYFSQTTSILIIDDFSSILRCEDNVVEHNHFVCDKLYAFCAILFSSRFTIGLNTFIVSRLEFFMYERLVFAQPLSGDNKSLDYGNNAHQITNRKCKKQKRTHKYSPSVARRIAQQPILSRFLIIFHRNQPHHKSDHPQSILFLLGL